MGTERFTYKEAAKALSISTDAVRMRVRRGTLPSERDAKGVKVLLNAEHLRSEVAYLREENQRKDHLIAALIQKVPALEAATDERREDSISHDDPSGEYPEYRITTGGPGEGHPRGGAGYSDNTS